MDTMLIKKLRALTAGLLMLGAVNQAQAVDFTGTLDLSTLVPNPSFYNISTAIDIERFDLGSALSGAYDILFTPGTFVPQATMLAFLISDNPNQSVIDDHSLLAPVAANISNLSTIIQGTYRAVYNVPSNATTNMRTYFPTWQFTSGTNYYLFAAGGSLVSTTVPFTLTVTAVPEPEVWAMMIAGLLMLFYQQFRRGRQQRLVLRST